jgi:uncharacterized repeat protein (TIGR03803 family)
MFDPAGNLYGTTSGSRPSNYGSLFELSPTTTGWSRTYLHTLRSVNADPTAGLIMDPQGNLYGTSQGGAGNYGSVYRVPPTKPVTVHTLHAFTPAQGDPGTNLVRDGQGNLYGETYYGGLYGYGTVFRISPGGAYTDIYDFPSTNPSPWWGLVMDGAGNLYGVTVGDGATSFGAVFEIQP